MKITMDDYDHLSIESSGIGIKWLYELSGDWLLNGIWFDDFSWVYRKDHKELRWK